MSVRVPTPNVSLVDVTFRLRKTPTRDEVNSSLREAASNGPLKGLLEYTEEPLVSSDFNGSKASAIVDATMTKVTKDLVKILAWYDNETGFSHRMLEVARLMG